MFEKERISRLEQEIAALRRQNERQDELIEKMADSLKHVVDILVDLKEQVYGRG